jgi:DNA helicase-2/ATP-dependent DNA helicase PcrA
MSEFLAELNKDQKKAAEIINGPVLVLAGAGSGKTKTLTYRIVNLMKNAKINGKNILALTFTNKAAREMQERVADLVSKTFPGENNLNLNEKLKANPWYLRNRVDNFPFIGTFHSFCLQVLKEDIEKLGFSSKFSIIDTDEHLKMINRLIKKLNLSKDRINPKAILSIVSGFKNQLIEPDLAKKRADNYFEEIAADIYKLYQEELKKDNLVDFDDLIMHTVKLFQNFKELQAKYQDRYPYLLVDEYQDTNHAQYQLINLLATKNQNIFVVGDDYQSIYAWRGANIKNILNFERDFKKAKVVYLEQNYRSTQKILDSAQAVIDKNPSQKIKKLWTENQKGDQIKVYEAQDQIGEAEYISEQILKLNKQGVTFDKMAILYRVNAQSRSIEEVLLKKAIPYRIVGGVEFFKRAEIKDLVAYLRLINNFNDKLSFTRIINVPKRSIGKVTLSKLLELKEDRNFQTKNLIDLIKDLYQDENQSFFSKAKIKDLYEFALLIEKIKKKSQNKNLSQLIELIIKKTGYDKFILDGTEKGQARLENILELISVAKRYDELEIEKAIENFLEETALATSEENPKRLNLAVTLMTLHASKGLEFEYVFIPGTEEGLLPHSRSINNPFEMEEERRLCYVGITRAMKKIWLIYVRNRHIFGQVIMGKKSRFIEDIPDKLVEKEISPPKIEGDFNYSETDEDYPDEDIIYID